MPIYHCDFHSESKLYSTGFEVMTGFDRTPNDARQCAERSQAWLVSHHVGKIDRIKNGRIMPTLEIP
jgi:hypothetical protein